MRASHVLVTITILCYTVIVNSYRAVFYIFVTFGIISIVIIQYCLLILKGDSRGLFLSLNYYKISSQMIQFMSFDTNMSIVKTLV
jgi:hypothetical protein